MSDDYKTSWEHADRSLRAIRCIRSEYYRLITEHDWLIGAETVLDMIDAALRIDDDE